MKLLAAIDTPMFDQVNAVGGCIVFALTYALGEHWYLFGAFLLFNILDYITGVFKAKVLNKESSSAGLLGIIKKLGYWIMIVVAFVIGAILSDMGEIVGADLSMFTPMIGWLILAMLAFNEVRSILENLVEIDVPVPSWLVKGLKVGVDKLNNIGDAMFDGELDVHPQSEDTYEVHMNDTPEKLSERDSVTLKIHIINEE